MKEVKSIICKCWLCENLKKYTDEKGRVRYCCPFVEGVEWLFDKCTEPLNPYCSKFVHKKNEEK